MWSPYQGATVQRSITFAQGNHFSGGRYHGPWRFNAFQTGQVTSLTGWQSWQSSPYSQDAGSNLQAP